MGGHRDPAGKKGVLVIFSAKLEGIQLSIVLRARAKAGSTGRRTR